MQVTVELNEADLLARMKNFEDHLVERKVVSDDIDWKKTAVAFANSAAVGIPAFCLSGYEITARSRSHRGIWTKFKSDSTRG